MAGVFEEHDRKRFEISAISYGPDDHGEMRDRLKAAFERFEDVSRLPDEGVVELIRQLDIEVLVDLGGFTAGARPKILARRAAPSRSTISAFPARWARHMSTTSWPTGSSSPKESRSITPRR